MTEQLKSIRASDVVLRIKSLDELSARWNGWQFDAETLELTYSDNEYPVDLESFRTSAKVLDMIIQIANKKWATDQCLAGLVHAINDIIHPQANLCTGGWAKTITREEIHRMLTLRTSMKAAT